MRLRMLIRFGLCSILFLDYTTARIISKRGTGDIPDEPTEAADTTSFKADGLLTDPQLANGSPPATDSIVPDTEVVPVSEMVPNTEPGPASEGMPDTEKPVDVPGTESEPAVMPETVAPLQFEKVGSVSDETVPDVAVKSTESASSAIAGPESIAPPVLEPKPGTESELGPVSFGVAESEPFIVPLPDTGTSAALPEIGSEVVPQAVTELQPGAQESDSEAPIQPIPIGGTGIPDVVGGVVDIDAKAPTAGSEGPAVVPTEDSNVFPFQGGFVFDSPFFSFSQIEDYFKKLEKAMEKIFRDTMLSVDADPEVYKNSSDRVVDVDGTRYKVHTTIIRGGDENNAVSIEAVSAIPADKRRKRSLF